MMTEKPQGYSKVGAGHASLSIKTIYHWMIAPRPWPAVIFLRQSTAGVCSPKWSSKC